MGGNGSFRTGRAAYRTPGVYYEERIRAVGISEFRTGVPVFVGLVDGGLHVRDGSVTIHELSSWDESQELFRGAGARGFLGHAIRAFFANGGERCFVAPVRSDSDNPLASITALTEPFSQGGIVEDLDDIDLVCVPDVMAFAGSTPRHAIIELQFAVLDHCCRMGNRFAILDPFPADANRAHSTERDESFRSLRDQRQTLLSRYGALYFPWIYVSQPTTRFPPGSRARNETIGSSIEPAKGTGGVPVPPCGHIAGIYARSDARVGVHKAPANEIIEDALDLEIDITDDEQAELNDAGVNCLRSLPGRGIRVWGARTLSGHPAWLYTNVTRLFLTLTRWVEQNMHELTFEPNDPSLWERTRQRIGAYCSELFERGALKGRDQSEAFFVKCDAETNPLDAREAGKVIAEIGLAPAVPAEFVIVRLTQSNTGVTVTASMT